VVGHHLNPFASGVARFNEILAGRLQVPVVGLFDPAVGGFVHPLLSFKVEELSDADRSGLDALLETWGAGRALSLFLHTWGDLELERRMVGMATRVWCGNSEVHERVRELSPAAEPVWAPGLLLDTRTFDTEGLSVFTFGMAHKIRVDMFVRLRSLLEATGENWSLFVSAANHETRTIEEAQAVFEEVLEVFPTGLYFLGNLSDVAVYNWLQHTTYFAAFFEGGVRANNTSVASAMEHGAVVITNLDDHSPDDLVHMENVIDLERCDELPSDPAVLERLGGRAREIGATRGWAELTARMATQGPENRA
jgi:hypothetical protein